MRFCTRVSRYDFRPDHRLRRGGSFKCPRGNKNPDTGELSSTLTSEEGTYQVSFLIPGNYVVTVEKPGFKRTVREGVHLEIAQHGVLDLELALGEVTQSVTVSENVQVLETESADRSPTFESRRVLDVPLMGRNPFSQAGRRPG